MRFRVQKLAFIVLVFILMPVLLWAAEEPILYVIQKGDTLWGLSEKFLNDPKHWPNLWSKNSRLTNPHLIYPGQLVRFKDGHLELVEAPVETAQKVVDAPAEPEVAEEKVFAVRGNEGWLMDNDLVPDGRIIAGQHGRLILGEDDTVYTDIGTTHGGSDGKKYTILRKSKQVIHPVTHESLGYRVYPLGSLQLTHATELNSRAIINVSFKEVEPGDLLVPYQEIKRKTIPLKMASRPLKGYIVESGSGADAVAAGDVVYLDIGKEQGVEAGNLLYIARKVKIEKMMVERYVGELPREVVGALVVVETGNKTSTAIVVKSIDAIFKGNEVLSEAR
jgi:hypothetical protein